MSCNSDVQNQPQTSCHSTSSDGPFQRFQQMIPNALTYAKQSKEKGTKIAGIFCEYTPRELFFAAGMLPICMCGGQESTIAEAETELPSNLCPLIKSSYGHALKQSNPFMEMADILVAETTCDGKKKMYELLSYRKPMHILELPQKPDDETAFQHWLHEIELLKKKLEAITGQSITDESLLEAIQNMNEERLLRRDLAYLSAEDPPLASGKEVLLLKSSLSLIPCDLTAYKTLYSYLKNRPSPYSNRPRILLTGVPIPHGAEKVMNIIEEAGAIVVAQENCTGLKPILEDVPENGAPLENLARKYFEMPCPCLTPNQNRTQMLSKLINDFSPCGIVDLVWQACHAFNIESELIRRQANQSWNLPYLKLETDYSPSDTAQLRVRIEAFLELCQTRKRETS